MAKTQAEKDLAKASKALLAAHAAFIVCVASGSAPAAEASTDSDDLNLDEPAASTDSDEFGDLGLDADEPKGLTAADVKKALSKFASKHGKEKVYALMAKFKAEKTSDIKEKDFKKLHDYCVKNS